MWMYYKNQSQNYNNSSCCEFTSRWSSEPLWQGLRCVAEWFLSQVLSFINSHCWKGANTFQDPSCFPIPLFSQLTPPYPHETVALVPSTGDLKHTHTQPESGTPRPCNGRARKWSLTSLIPQSLLFIAPHMGKGSWFSLFPVIPALLCVLFG